MKRNDDGYVLPLVLVVLLVLGIVVSSVLAASLQNLRFQNNSIARTEARCEAEGVVEIVKAQVLALVGEESEAETKDSVSSSEIKKELKDTKKMCEAVKAKLAEIQSIVLNPDINKSGLTISIAIKDDNWSETVEATSAKFAFPLLIKAIDSFDPSNGARFATYATRCLQNEILMHFHSQKKHSMEVSLGEAIDTDRDGNPLTYIDIISCDDTIAEDIDLKLSTRKALELVKTRLDEREREIIVMRYGLDGRKPVTQRELADKLGISRSYVSRIEKAALEKLREKL